MRERIDGERVVPGSVVLSKSPEKERQSADEKKARWRAWPRNHVVICRASGAAGNLAKSSDVVEAGVVVFVGNDPADVRPEKPKAWGSEDRLPDRENDDDGDDERPTREHPFARSHGHESDDELKDAAGFEERCEK